jgi:hypothetical protein
VRPLHCAPSYTVRRPHRVRPRASYTVGPSDLALIIQRGLIIQADRIYSARPHLQCAPRYSAASYPVGHIQSAPHTARGLIYSAPLYTAASYPVGHIQSAPHIQCAPHTQWAICSRRDTYSARPHIQCAPHIQRASYTVRGLIHSEASYTGGLMHSAASCIVRPHA